jgi:hypothetical protein
MARCVRCLARTPGCVGALAHWLAWCGRCDLADLTSTGTPGVADVNLGTLRAALDWGMCAYCGVRIGSVRDCLAHLRKKRCAVYNARTRTAGMCCANRIYL